MAVYVLCEWEGVPIPDGEEGTEVRFFGLDDLPVPLGPVDGEALGLGLGREQS